MPSGLPFAMQLMCPAFLVYTRPQVGPEDEPVLHEV